MKKIIVLGFSAIIVFTSNAQLKSECITGDCQNGKGTYNYSNGDSYTGDFKNGLLEGVGKYKWANTSTICVGDFKNGVLEGRGAFYYESGMNYIGSIKNFKYSGEGTFTLNNGFYMKGIFENGVGAKVKIYDDKNKEISREAFVEEQNSEAATYDMIHRKKMILQNKEKFVKDIYMTNLQNDISNMTYRTSEIDMQFSNNKDEIFYIKRRKNTDATSYDFVNADDITFFNVYNTKRIGSSSLVDLEKNMLGNSIIGSFQKSDYQQYGINYSFGKIDVAAYNDRLKHEAYINSDYQLIFNKHNSTSLLNQGDFSIELYNNNTKTTKEYLSSFKFWKDKNEFNAFLKKEDEAKDKYLSYIKLNFDQELKLKKEQFKKFNDYQLYDLHATYDELKNKAYVLFTFSRIPTFGYYVLYEIDFKNHESKKIYEKEYQITLNDGFYSFTNNGIFQIVNFDGEENISIDKSFLEKLNNLTNPAGNVEFDCGNKDYLIFKSKKWNTNTNYLYSYYFYNRQKKVCEKIVNLTIPYFGNEMVWNADYTKSAIKLICKFNSNSTQYYSSIYFIDWETLEVNLIDDHTNQQNYIANSKAYKAKDDAAWAKYMEGSADRAKELELFYENKRRSDIALDKKLKMLDAKPLITHHYYINEYGNKIQVD